MKCSLFHLVFVLTKTVRAKKKPIYFPKIVLLYLNRFLSYYATFSFLFRFFFRSLNYPRTLPTIKLFEAFKLNSFSTYYFRMFTRVFTDNFVKQFTSHPIVAIRYPNSCSIRRTLINRRSYKTKHTRETPQAINMIIVGKLCFCFVFFYKIIVTRTF